MANTNESEILALKDEGNRLFQKKDYTTAISVYSRAIDSCLGVDFNTSSKINKEFVSVLYCNRAACHMRLSQHNNALQDAEKSLKWNPQYHKAHYRHGNALAKLQRYKEAEAAFENSRKIIMEEMNNEPSSASSAQKTSLQDTENALENVQLLQLLPQQKPEELRDLSEKDILEILSANIQFLKSEKFAKEVSAISVRLGATGRRCAKSFVIDDNGRLMSQLQLPISPEALFTPQDKQVMQGLKDGEYQPVTVYVQLKLEDLPQNSNNKPAIVQQHFFIQQANISRFPSRPLSTTQSYLLELSAEFATAKGSFNKHFDPLKL